MHQETDELCGVEAIRRDWIDGLLRNLRREIAVDELYVFGSRAKNEHLTWSDYDVCVVSSHFRSLPFWKRMELVLGCWEGERAVEPVCFTPEEFQRGDSTLIGEIRRQGIRIYPG
ncbi:MAG TPA: nucleotidyltransferase domain-containing protein [Acidobacteriota bacterium]|jgi:hypothetical protein|nr:nucleotidyltransferase domain-containing protein [Acidobacteriota bacterium]